MPMPHKTDRIVADEPVRPLAFSTDGAAKMLGLSAKTLANWRCLGKGPVYIRVGESSQAQVLYRYEDLVSWLSSMTPQGGRRSC